MTIDPDVIQNAIDQAQERYEENSILSKEIVEHQDKRFQAEECAQALEMNVESINNTLHSTNITNVVDRVLSCERQKLLNGLEEESDQSEEIGEEVVGDILKAMSDVSVPTYLYLPNEPKFRMRMEQHGSADAIGIQYDVPVHWFPPDVFDSKGFLLDNGVFVNQHKQGTAETFAGNVDVELSNDNSENRLKTFLRRVRGGKVELDFRSVFSLPRKIDNKSTVLNLELSDIEDI